MQVAFSHDDSSNFVEKDLQRAIEGLQEHDVELSDILGEESCLFNESVPSSLSASCGPSSSSSSMDFDDELL